MAISPAILYPPKSEQARLPRTVITTDRGAWATVGSWLPNHDARVAWHVGQAEKAGRENVGTRTVTPIVF